MMRGAPQSGFSWDIRRISRMGSGLTHGRPSTSSPEVAESLSMPPDDGLRLDQDEGRAPLLPDPRQAHPEGPVGHGVTWSGGLVTEDGELLTEGEIFQSQLRTVPKRRGRAGDEFGGWTPGPPWVSWLTGIGSGGEIWR